MEILKIDAEMFKNMFLAGAKRLDSRKEYINELNVFPVPDGDTGTNMTMTIMSAAKELAAVKDPTLASMAKAVSQGALRGARGNSGVILSQLFRGFARVITEHEYIDSSVAAEAFKKASETAYKAVMKPKEGTILTVARGMSEKAQDVLEQTDDMAVAFEQIIEYGNYMLSLTPEMLPVLKQAGVVDSGGKGLMTVLEGAFDCLMGRESAYDMTDFEPSYQGAASVDFKLGLDEIDTADIKFAYCTEFIIMLEKEFKEEDEDEIKEYLSSIGDSLVCVADDEIVKIHVHTNDPGLAIQKALTYGSLTKMKIDNMREEHNERLFKDAEKMAMEQAKEDEKKKASHKGPMKDRGFVAVSVGEGLNDILKGLGVDVIVEGGQTMNPSTADILDAAGRVNAKTVYVLPNNKNIILASTQAAEMSTDKKIIVIPSTNIPQGLTALINYNDSLSDEENAENMTNEMTYVSSAQVTFAVRDTEIGGKQVHKDDYMGLGDEGLVAVGKDLSETTIKTIEEIAGDDSEIITIYYGCDVEQEAAESLGEKVREIFPECEVEVYSGGQPIYYYLLSVE